MWRFVALILEKNLRPFVEITSGMSRLGNPAWARGRGTGLETPDLQAILKHLRGKQSCPSCIPALKRDSVRYAAAYCHWHGEVANISWLMGLCRGTGFHEVAPGREERHDQLKHHYLNLLLGNGRGAAWET